MPGDTYHLVFEARLVWNILIAKTAAIVIRMASINSSLSRCFDLLDKNRVDSRDDTESETLICLEREFIFLLSTFNNIMCFLSLFVS